MAKVRVLASNVGSVTDYLRSQVGDRPRDVADAWGEGLMGKVVCSSTGTATNFVEERDGVRRFVIGGGQAKVGPKGGRPPGAQWARGELALWAQAVKPSLTFEGLAGHMVCNPGHLCESALLVAKARKRY